MKKNFISIIAEYNPLHNGHLYQLKKIKQMYPNSDVIVIMSGNFTQRCDPAIISKWSRAKQAIATGVDCVIELPVLFSTAPAEIFASAGVYIANALGLIDKLVFSTESDNIELLQRLANLSTNEKVLSEMKKFLSEGLSFPTALQSAMEKYSNEQTACDFKLPNNILAIEYIKALKKFHSDIEPIAIKRKYVAHDSMITHENFASATFLRDNIIKNNTELINHFMPTTASEILKNSSVAELKNLERLIFATLRTSSKKKLSEIAYVNEGLENRIKKFAYKTDNIEALLLGIKTKRYTYSRIKRIILYSILNIKKPMVELKPQYARILAVNQNKLTLINELNKRSELPIVVSGKEILSLGRTANIIFELEQRATELYSVSTNKILSCDTNMEFSKPLIKL